jgi:type I restriction enzyme S subunit
MKFSKGAKMPRGDKASILKYPVAIPPIADQNRIVSILDKFERLVNDISTGLPAEIAARRQQYEYYRNKLLTFKELSV